MLPGNAEASDRERVKHEPFRRRRAQHGAGRRVLEAGLCGAALVALMGCGKAREDHSQQVAPTPVPASVSQQAIEEDANIGPAAPPEDEQGGVAEVGSGSGGGGSAGAPAPEPDPGMTREEYLALIKRNEDLRADIRATNPKLQLIIDGKFDEFERLLDNDRRLATVRWGYYEDKPDPLNPLHPPPRGGPNALHLAAEHGALKLVRRRIALL